MGSWERYVMCRARVHNYPFLPRRGALSSDFAVSVSASDQVWLDRATCARNWIIFARLSMGLWFSISDHQLDFKEFREFIEGKDYAHGKIIMNVNIIIISISFFFTESSGLELLDCSIPIGLHSHLQSQSRWDGINRDRLHSGR